MSILEIRKNNMRSFFSLRLLLALSVLFLMTPARQAAADPLVIDSGTVYTGDNFDGYDSVLLNGGTLNVNSGFSLPLTLVGGIVTNTGEHTVSSNIDVQTGTTLFQMTNANLNLSGNLTGSGTLNKTSGQSTIYLSGNNSGFEGTYIVSAYNTYFIGNDSGSAAARWVLSDSSANFSPVSAATSGTAMTIHLGSLSGTAGALRQDGNTNTTYIIGALGESSLFSGSIRDYYTILRDGSQGTVSIEKVGSGTLTLIGSDIYYTGGTTVSGGTLDITDTTLYGGTTNPGVVTVRGAGSTLKISQLDTAFGTLSNAAANIVLENGGTLEITGGYHLSDRGITLAGTGGSVLYNPTAGGWIDWHGGPDINIPTGATFTIGGSGDINLKKVISGGGNLEKIGSGTLTIGNAGNGELSYSGLTSVLGGMLIRDSDYDYSGTFFINNGATLRFYRGVCPARNLDGITTPMFTFGDKGGTLEINSGNFHTNWVSQFIFATTSGGDADHIAKSYITTTSSGPGLNMGGWNGGDIVFDVAEYSELLFSANMGNGGACTLIKKGYGLMTFTGEFRWGSGTFTNRPVTVAGGTLNIQAAGDAWNISDLKIENGATLILDKQGTRDVTVGRITGTNGTLHVVETTNFTVEQSFTTTPGKFYLDGAVNFVAGEGLRIGDNSVFSPGVTENSFGTATINGTFGMDSGSILQFDFSSAANDLLNLTSEPAESVFSNITLNLLEELDYAASGYEFLRGLSSTFDYDSLAISYATGFEFDYLGLVNHNGVYSLHGFITQEEEHFTPEPATWGMLLLGGIAVFGGVRRRMMKK